MYRGHFGCKALKCALIRFPVARCPRSDRDCDARPQHYGALQADHVVAAALQRTQTLSRELLRIYEDADGCVPFARFLRALCDWLVGGWGTCLTHRVRQRREELAAMAGGAAMDTFVVKASEIRVYYARHASDDLHEEPPSIYDELKPELSFSGNEVRRGFAAAGPEPGVDMLFAGLRQVLGHGSSAHRVSELEEQSRNDAATVPRSLA